MIQNTCPICHSKLKENERLVLEYIPAQNHWVMLHLKPISPGMHEHSRYPGFSMWCGQAANWKPATY